MMLAVSAVIGVILSHVLLTQAYPGGPPNASSNQWCTDMKPQHGYGVHQSYSWLPYEIRVSPYCFNEGSSVKVTLSRNDDFSHFKGFLIQARDTYGKLHGSFSWTDQTIRYDCDGGKNNTIAQNNPFKYEMTEKTVTWQAPFYTTYNGIQFYATVVQEQKIYWMNVTSTMLFYDSLCHSDALTYPTEYPVPEGPYPYSADAATATASLFLLLAVMILYVAL